jgi:hypothetical protein
VGKSRHILAQLGIVGSPDGSHIDFGFAPREPPR